MKHLKVFGLTAIAALGLMAFVGAGAASATTLFADKEHALKYPAATTVHTSLKSGTSSSWKDTSNNTIATCTSSTQHWFTSNETGTGIFSQFYHWLFGECSQTTDVLAAGSIEIMWTSGESGAVRGSGSEVTFSIFGVSCTYGTGEGTALGTISSGVNPVLSVNASLPKIAGGFLCPSTSVWKAEYVVTAPSPLYITN